MEVEFISREQGRGCGNCFYFNGQLIENIIGSCSSNYNDRRECGFGEKGYFIKKEQDGELPTNISMEWDYCSMDDDKEWYAFQFEPRKSPGRWGLSQGYCVKMSGVFANLPKNIPWKESLHKRQSDGTWERVPQKEAWVKPFSEILPILEADEYEFRSVFGVYSWNKDGKAPFYCAMIELCGLRLNKDDVWKLDEKWIEWKL